MGTEERTPAPRRATPKLQAASWIQLDRLPKSLPPCPARNNRQNVSAGTSHADFKPIELPVRLQAHVASQLHAFRLQKCPSPKFPVLTRDAAGPSCDIYSPLRTIWESIRNVDRDNIYNGCRRQWARGCRHSAGIGASPGSVAKPAAGTLDSLCRRYPRGRAGPAWLPNISANTRLCRRGKISVDLNYGTAFLPSVIRKKTEVSGAERTTFLSPLMQSTAKEFGFRDPPPNSRARRRDITTTVRIISAWPVWAFRRFPSTKV